MSSGLRAWGLGFWIREESHDRRGQYGTGLGWGAWEIGDWSG